MNKQFASLFIADSPYFDDAHPFVYVVENSKSINAQFPLGDVVGTKFLPIASFYTRFILELSVNLIKDIFLLELSERVQIVPGFRRVFNFIHRRTLSPPLRSLATFCDPGETGFLALRLVRSMSHLLSLIPLVMLHTYRKDSACYFFASSSHSVCTNSPLASSTL